MTVDSTVHGLPQRAFGDPLRALLDAKAEVNKADDDGRDSTALGLLQWAPGGSAEVPRQDAKAEVNKADSDGRTPLYWASQKGTWRSCGPSWTRRR